MTRHDIEADLATDMAAILLAEARALPQTHRPLRMNQQQLWASGSVVRPVLRHIELQVPIAGSDSPCRPVTPRQIERDPRPLQGNNPPTMTSTHDPELTLPCEDCGSAARHIGMQRCIECARARRRTQKRNANARYKAKRRR